MAGQRLTDKTALEQQTGSGDLFMLVDVNDTTGSAAGTSKKIDSKFIIQTDKISVSNAEIQDLSSNEKILVGALSGYMVNPISVTMLCTYAASDESSGSTLLFGFDDSTLNSYYTRIRSAMNGLSTNVTYVVSSFPPGGGACSTSILNKPFIIWSDAAFNGGWSADFYVTYSYTKIL